MTLVETASAKPNGAAPAMHEATEAPPFATPLAEPPTRRPARRIHSAEATEGVRVRYEGTTMTLDAISAETGVAKTTISAMARREHWTRMEGAPPTRTEGGGRSAPGRRKRLVGRLFRVCGRQLATLEKRAGTDAADEKDARTLNVLAKTLETLIALDRDDGAKTKPEPADRGDYRAELARTLRRWAEEGSRPGDTDPDPV